MSLPFFHKSQLSKIKSLLEPNLLNRGFTLFREGKVDFIYFDPAKEIYFFDVAGNMEPFYSVSISLEQLNRNVLRDEKGFEKLPDKPEESPITCECVYFIENHQCKHVAAAIYYLALTTGVDYQKFPPPWMENQKTLKVEKKEPEEEELSFPITIPCSEKEIPQLGGKMDITPGKFINERLYNTELLENGITYSVDINGQFHFLKIHYDGKQIIINGDFQRKYLVRTGLEWLKKRFSQSGLGDLYYLTSGQRKTAAADQLRKWGLLDQLEDPIKAFGFEFYEGQVVMFPAGPLRGLYHIDRLSKKFIEEGIRMADLAASNQLIPNVKTDELGKYNPGFALVIDHYDNFQGILSFMAKGSKNKPSDFSVRFTAIADSYDPRLAKNSGMDEALLAAEKLNQAIIKKKTDQIFSLFEDFLTSMDGYHLSTYQAPAYEYQKGKIQKKNFGAALRILPARLGLKISKKGLIYELHPLISTDEGKLEMENEKNELSLFAAFALYKHRWLLTFQTKEALLTLKVLLNYTVLQFLEKDVDEYVQKIILPLSKNIEIMDESGLFKEADHSPLLQKQLYISELTGLVIFRPALKYGPRAFSNPLEGNSIMDPETKTLYLRDEDAEDEFLAFLKALHPNFERGGNQGFFHLNHDAFMENLWFMKAFETLKANKVTVFGLENIKIKKYSPFPPKVTMEFGSTQDWFELNAQVAFGNNKVKLKDIKSALDKNRNYVELSDGTIGILPEEWVRKFSRLFRSGETEKEQIKISKTQFNLLDEVEEIHDFPEILKEIEEKKERLKQFSSIRNTKIPQKLKADLRPYQQVGLNWLNFLQEYGWGGILADDMGLGKTLQLISLICKMREKQGTKVLVVAPTTLLFNWKDELEKFAPHLDYFIHHGSRYDSVEALQGHEVLLTSYGLVINDLELLKQITFDIIIADESQAIKNTQSLRYKAITKLNGKLKIALTGTPIENGLAELYAQMNFVNPGFFQSFKGFKDHYLDPLKKGNTGILDELQKKIKPFVLRRTKKEVLTELPDKTEEYLYCEMDPVQRKVYDAYRNEFRDYLMKKFEEEGAGQSKMYVLEGLTRLRQICDATRLVNHAVGKDASAKIDLLLEHILEKTGNHKLLVFSQFVKMLDIVQERLQENHVSYTYLDGKTSLKERESRVNQFQQDPSKRVFLISLKAGGTGLNLTAADYVYILDPWWNPAVENQAIDRCYRMGQEKHVIAYRMICKDTVEEKIMKLQAAKSKMAKEVIVEGDSFLGTLDGEGMLSLFD
ncbi:DEAD/DEAH box helicase family protein [Cyclobacterium sp. GBPx2]|uniref:DEAD/DEAH box helicase family protein n=2 Tax=Cyclobacterium plantarum TaxID=2716263 RepID=A0ABX0H4P2_9BACT|nr:DEAD/DEAH box helicase family protein [Cyclobacterium plantarum]